MEGDWSRGLVSDKFAVQQYPTLVLLDADGTELWRGSPGNEQQLEAILRRRLR